MILDKDGIVFAHITEFMRNIRRQRSGELGLLEHSARKAGYPIVDPETSDLLEILCRIKKPVRILEIGTCIGFSSLLMLNASPLSEIITIERNPAMISPAKENFARFSAEKIRLLEGDAADILPTFTEKFDFIFLDAAKGQYPLFLKECLRLLEKGGVLVCDNVLFNGRVVTKIPDIRRNKTIINRLSSFLEDLESELSVKTVILPISDGVTVSVKEECTDEKALP